MRTKKPQLTVDGYLKSLPVATSVRMDYEAVADCAAYLFALGERVAALRMLGFWFRLLVVCEHTSTLYEEWAEFRMALDHVELWLTQQDRTEKDDRLAAKIKAELRGEVLEGDSLDAMKKLLPLDI